MKWRVVYYCLVFIFTLLTLFGAQEAEIRNVINPSVFLKNRSICNPHYICISGNLVMTRNSTVLVDTCEECLVSVMGRYRSPSINTLWPPHLPEKIEMAIERPESLPLIQIVTVCGRVECIYSDSIMSRLMEFLRISTRSGFGQLSHAAAELTVDSVDVIGE